MEFDCSCIFMNFTIEIHHKKIIALKIVKHINLIKKVCWSIDKCKT